MREWQEKNTGIIRNAERFTLFGDAVDMQIQVNRDAEKRILESVLHMKKLSNV